MIEDTRKEKIILFLILFIFFLKGAFLTTLFPIFTGQDEARHYSSLQYGAEPKNKSWGKIDRRLEDRKKINIADYNFSEEMIKAGEAADFDVFRHELYDTVNFSKGYNGANEEIINSRQWKPYNYFKQPDTAGISDLYHRAGSSIEKFLENNNILVRFFSNRIFSVLLGTIGIFLAYFIFKTIGLKEKYSLILTAIVAFQPKYAMYSANINYDVLLIPLFFLFTLGGVLSLKNGFNWKNGIIMLLAIVLGIFTKPTALILLPPFIGLIFYFIFINYKKNINLKIILLAILGFLILAWVNRYYNITALLHFKNSLSETISSLGDYLEKSLTMGRFGLSSRTYWGSLGWFDSPVEKNFTDIVWLIEAASAIGIIIFLFFKKKLEHLPEKKYIIFFLGMIIALQLGIRMADWKIFIEIGNLGLGTPGRYFLPNLVSHIALVFIGLGALLKKEKYFHPALIIGLILMLMFSMYLIFSIILPRYYL